MYSTDPRHLAAEIVAERRAQRVAHAAVDAALAEMGLPGEGAANVGHSSLTHDQAAILGHYALGVFHRAGLAEALRTCAISDALERGDVALGDALGVRVVPKHEGSREVERVPPVGVPRLGDAEGAARVVARRALAGESARLGGDK